MQLALILIMNLWVSRFVENVVLRWFELDVVSKIFRSVLYNSSDIYAVDVFRLLASSSLCLLQLETAGFLVMGFCYYSQADVGLWHFL